jgi:hypothetical protein
LLEFLSTSRQLLGKAHDRLIGRSDSTSEQLGSLGSTGSGNGDGNGTSTATLVGAGRPNPAAAGGGANGVGSGSGPVTAENQNRRWLEEMDIGYRSLISEIHPYLKDICDIGQLAIDT